MAGTTMQERISAIEVEARERLARAITQSNSKLAALDRKLGRVARDDWSVPGMKRHVESWRARAENLRAAAVKRAGEMPGEAVTALVTGTRAPLRTLSRQLADIAKRLEPEKKAEHAHEGAAAHEKKTPKGDA